MQTARTKANSNPGLSAEEKDTFYERVFSKFASVPEEEMLVLGGDFNGYVGKHSAWLKGIHGGSGYGMRNHNGLCILDFCVSNKLAIINTFFARIKVSLLLFHLEVITPILTSSLLGEHN